MDQSQMTISFDLTEKNWRSFYNAHYISDKRFKLRFLYGTASWLIGTLGLLGLFDNKPIAFGMIVFGLYCVFIKQYLINKAIKKIRSHPEFPGKIDYLISRQQISGSNLGKDFAFPWEELYGYRAAAPGLLFYLKQTSFFFIPNEAISPEQQQEIIGLLQLNKVKDLAAQQ